jgi:hypothetical protein
VPANLAQCRERWNQHRDLLEEFAVNRNIGDIQMSDQSREPHYRAFARELFYSQNEPQDPPDGYEGIDEPDDHELGT